MTLVGRICQWNAQRYAQMHDSKLTNSLLSEELGEFIVAETEVDELDALVDIIYVAIGAIWKMGLTQEQVEEAIHAVCDSNDSKDASITAPNVKANIIKGAGYFRPEPKLQEILDARTTKEI